MKLHVTASNNTNDSAETKAFQALYQGVIRQALEDAMTFARDQLMRHLQEKRGSIQDKLRNWFTRANKDFRITCELAGFDPDKLRSKVLAQLAAKDAEIGHDATGDIAEPPEAITRKRYTAKGMTLSMDGWSKKLGVPYHLLRNRLYSGMSIEEIIRRVESGEVSEAARATAHGHHRDRARAWS